MPARFSHAAVRSRSLAAHLRGTVVPLAVTVLLGLPLSVPGPTSAAEPLTGKMAFTNYSDGDADIWVTNADATGGHAVTFNAAWDSDPVWSPEGTRVAYTKNGSSGGSEIWVTNEDGTGSGPAAAIYLNDLAVGDWSPDGTLLLGTERAVNPETFESMGTFIVTVELATGQLTRLGSYDDGYDAPTYSPDGSEILLTLFRPEDPDGGSDLWAMNIESGERRRITDTNAEEHGAAWSPDGTRIAFHGDGEVWAMNADGSGITQLTSDAENYDESPVWSPDSTSIAFASSREPSGLWVMNADGTELRPMPAGSGVLSPGDWIAGSVAPLAPPQPVTGSVEPGAPSGTATEEGPTDEDPLQTTVSSPYSGSFVIAEGYQITESPPTDYTFLGQQVSIEVSTDPATTAENPLQLDFALDYSLIPQNRDPMELEVFRNGELIAACTLVEGLPPATPDPCVSSKFFDSDNLVLYFSVLTSHASEWNFGLGPRTNQPPTINAYTPTPYEDYEPIGEVAAGEPGVYVKGAQEFVYFECLDDSSTAACWGEYEDGGTLSPGDVLDTSRVGTRTVTLRAQDDEGAEATLTVSYRVIYAFRGFRQPVDNPLPDGTVVLNKVKSGASVPIKFSLGGDQGLAIFGAGSPSVAQISCTPNAQVDQIEQTVTTPGGLLVYDAKSGQYTYTLKTTKSWAGTCRELTVRLADGTVHRAQFKGS